MKKRLYKLNSTDLYSWTVNSSPDPKYYIYTLGQCQYICVGYIDFKKIGVWDDTPGKQTWNNMNIKTTIENNSESVMDYIVHICGIYDNYALSLKEPKYKYIKNLSEKIGRYENLL